MIQICWEEEPDLDNSYRGTVRLVKLASLGLASHERNVRAGDAKIVQLTGRELVEFIDGVAVTAPVAVRADQVHRVIPSSLRNWGSIHLVCCSLYKLLFSQVADPTLHSCLAGSARHHKSIRLAGHKIAANDLISLFAGCVVSYMFSNAYGCGSNN